MIRKLVPSLLSLALVAGAIAAPAHAQVPEGDPKDLPFFSNETPAGGGSARDVQGPAPVAKTIDGDISDWVGTSSMYGGTTIYSGGEFIYQDHIFDATGPDDGRDTRRFEQTDPLEENYPGTYRFDALAQADAAGELGIPVEDIDPEYSWNDTYGDATSHQDSADLAEVRVALNGDALDLLARTTTMKDANGTALLVLADTTPGETSHQVPFNSGLTTTTGDVAFFVTDGTTLVADLATGVVTPAGGSAVAKPDGWTNALEASLPAASLVGPDGTLSLAVASGTPSDDDSGFKHLTIEMDDDLAHANVANVAFRTDEPVRIWFDKTQALDLYQGSIDRFFAAVDTNLLTSGASQEFLPGAGYHDRIFLSDPATGVPTEGGQQGIYQHYGVFVPSAYAGEPVPLQWWLHWRGGSAHSGASVVPKVMKQFGEDKDTIVVAPSGRGSSTWYVGRGHVDILEVWKDVFDTFAIDRDRVYVTGHSMGGWGSYLLALLYPDRFAAASPVAGPVTQGAWTGLDFPGCDSFKSGDNTPCYIAANGSRPRDQHTRKLLDNALHVPFAILQGTDDELVPVTGVTRQTEQLALLGYRYRYYLSPGYEHYSHPIMDQWAEAASYLHQFTRPENPARVVYKRDMPFEIATEEVQSNGVPLNFSFDSAYWMSGLKATEPRGTAKFDGTSLAISETPYRAAPDTAAPTAPGQTGPYIVTGLQWLDDPTASAPAPQNAFQATLTGASGVQLDLARMDIDPAQVVVGSATTDGPLSLKLDGGWTQLPSVTVDSQPASGTLTEGVLEISLGAGTHAITITPVNTPQEVTTQLAFTDGSDTSAQYSDTATLEARLTAGDAGLAGEEVVFALGSETASAVTDGNGVATTTLPVTQEPGDGSATVTFGGRSGELSPSVATVPFTVNKDDSTSVLALSGKSSKRSLTATLTDSDSGAGLAGRTIDFFADGQKIGSATTNANGVASFDLPAKYSGGKHSFKGSFGGDSYYLGSSATTG